MTEVSKIDIVVADNESKKTVKLAKVLLGATWEVTIDHQPGKLEFEYLEKGDSRFGNGSNVVLFNSGVKVFDGFVFSQEYGENSKVKVTAYDRLRYLNNVDTFIFKNKSVNEIVSEICNSQKLPFKITHGSSYKVPSKVFSGKSLYEMIQYALDSNLIGTKQYLILRDNAGTLELVDVAKLETDLLIGPKSLLMAYGFATSIDSGTANFVKLEYENKDTKQREIYIAKDSSTIAKWGQLHYYEKVSNKDSAHALKKKADQLLKLYNRQSKSLKVTCIGNFKVREGCGIYIDIPELTPLGVPSKHMVFVRKATHTIDPKLHKMDLILEVL